MEAKKVLDVKGLSCPMPIVKTKKAIDELDSGDILEVHATDPGSKNDLTAWTESSGHELLESKEEDGVFKYWVKKG
ncbi:TusA-related sulfurtransferase [Melghiribacillus thermohalophilus]|uniref:TusA-related sulfurtransferase n=1 Tax=Melghiribacillus thermohalophilus TaxID=1324956 RepID=A0A4R3MU78_9BACI|nr:sulfurtransferase TusA family protein [Melghiribacillus thermohalophilus]TCT20018.1 TusA-related sulfurtransferase [Melghiribacillus thermohalophilus]